MKNRRLFVFLLLQAVLYTIFLFLDFKGGSSGLSTAIKYCVILLCFIYVLLNKREDCDISNLLLMRAALLFTLISDFIILFWDSNCYIYGVITFIIVQQLYTIRLMTSRDRGKALHRKTEVLHFWLLQLSGELTVMAILLFIFRRKGLQTDWLIIASSFYFICLVRNTIHSIIKAAHKHRTASDVLFALGLLLFLLCDINVGIYNLSEYIVINGRLTDILFELSSILMWAFYAPSQVLLAISIASAGPNFVAGGDRHRH